jgi:putative Flp pilus-assembly TadE/G-like protein
MSAILLPVLLAFAGLAVDVGHAFVLKRHLQAAADAAALAGVQELPDAVAARAEALAYGAEAGGRNHRTNLPSVTTQIHFLNANTKIKVVYRATSPVFFARILGIGTMRVRAQAVASKSSTATGTPRAIHVHELCPGVNGLLVNGLNARIEGGIHVNGKFKIAGAGFESVGAASVYRPTDGSPPGPAQGTCNGSSPQFVEDEPDSRYCTGCASGAVDKPVSGAYVGTWATPYHTEAIMKAATPCTDTTTPLLENVNVATPTVYCPSGKFEIKGNVTGNITVIGPEIVLNATGTLRPANAEHPVLFYSTSATKITVNPSGALDWVGYVINRQGGIEINSGNVESPRQGLLEAQWILVNGENFRMLGTFADSPEGTIGGGPRLEE